jgi:uncharacterized protein (TIGR01777 family)
MKIVLAGGTGFIGKAIRKEFLSAGHEVTVLTRSGNSAKNEREKFIVWDGKTEGDWAAHLEGAGAVINLSGENIAAKRWTAARKEVLLSSRIDATRAIVNAIGKLKDKPAVLVNASAVGYYGDHLDAELTEAAVCGNGFLAEICERWEAEARKASTYGVRVVLARFGPVLGDHGGMLAKMVLPFRFFAGAPLGSGKQWIPWVHREDAAQALCFLLEHKELSGPVNITAPVPATMKEFSRALAAALRRPLWFPVPAFLLKAFLGEMAAVVLSSQRAVPQKLLEAGYHFKYPHLSGALRAIFSKTE